jgi:hypothetical protein
LIIFVVTTAVLTLTGSVGSTRGVRVVARKDAAASRCGLGRVVVLAVEVCTGGPLQVVAEVEVRGEPVTQILDGGDRSALSWSRPE